MKNEKKEQYHLSDAQQRIVELEDVFKGNKCNNLGMILIAKDNVTIDQIETTMNECIAELDGFQLRINKIDDHYIQYFGTFKFEAFDRYDFSNRQEEFDAFIEAAMNQSYFNINDKLYKFILFTSVDGRAGCMMILHHIITDGWSLVDIMGQLVAKKLSKSNNQIVVNTYEEYIKTQQNQRISPKVWEYWKNKVDTSVINQEQTKPHLTDVDRCHRHTYVLAEAESQFFHEALKGQNITVPRLFLAALILLKAWHDNTSSVSIGMAMLGRRGRKERSTFGVFSKLLPLLVNIEHQGTVRDFFKQIESEMFQLFRFSEQSYAEIQDYAYKSGINGNYLETCYSYQNVSFSDQLREVFPEIQWLNPQEQCNEITVHVNERDEKGHLCFEYDYQQGRYQEAEIAQYHQYFVHIAKELIRLTNKENSILNEINYLLPMEKEIINSYHTVVKEEYPDVITLFEKAVKENEEKQALGTRSGKYNYKELNGRVNRIANALISNGIKAGDAVAISGSRSEYILMGMLGILKAGACYVPIDCKYPKIRKEFILKDTKANYILFGRREDNDDLFTVPSLYVKELINSGSERNPQISCKGRDLAYIMYTSGTNGNPKGVMIEHRSISRLVNNTDYFDFDRNKKILATGSIAFDASTFEYYGSLLNGGYVYIASENQLEDIKEIANVIENENINTIWLTTALFNHYVDENSKVFTNVHSVLTGGDRISEYHVRKLYHEHPSIQIYNGYGPTENTTFTSVNKIPKNFDSISIGKPIKGTQCYVLRGNKQVGIGIPGELCVTGDGVGRGYLNCPEYTEQKFLKNPFGEDLMYRTGDLVKWLPNGTLDFIGRIDNQVKIRGFRVELGDIEEQLKNQAGVQNAIVLYRNKILQAYLVMEDDAVDIEHVKHGLHGLLPDYMIPQAFAEIDEIPVTINGKVDVNKLPDINMQDAEFTPPRNSIEKILCKAIEESIGCREIGIDHCFFELGGDSIKAIRVVSTLRKNGMAITVKDIIKYQTVRAICDNQLVEVSEQIIEQDNIHGEVKLSPIQSRFFKDNYKNKNYFLQSILLETKSALDHQLLARTIQILLDRHDMLRAVYGDGQQIREAGLVKPLIIHCNMDAIQEAVHAWEQSLDITKGNLFAAFIISTVQKEYLLLRAHHLLVDGISWRILSKDLVEIYNALGQGGKPNLPLKTVSYKTWVEDQYNFIQTSQAEGDKQYWTSVVGECQSIESPFDKATDLGKLKYKEINCSRDKIENLQIKYQKNIGIDSNSFYLGLVSHAVSKWKGIKKLVVNMEGHGRENLLNDLPTEETVGWFTNKYPVSVSISGKIQEDMIKNHKLLAKVPHHGLSYGILRYLADMEELNIKGDIVYNFLGDMSIDGINDDMLSFSADIKVLDNDPDNQQEEAMSINIMYSGRKLKFLIFYNDYQISEIDMEKFKNILLKSIEEFEEEKLSKTKSNCMLFEEISDVVLSEQDEEQLEEMLQALCI